jgi:hypothetical protein
VVLQQESPVIDCAPTQPDDPVSARRALLTCLPGLLALSTYVVEQYRDVPAVIGYLFWPLLALGVVVGAVCLVRFRRSYRGRSGPWYISLSVAVHTVVLLVGVPFLLLLLVGALTGNLG